MIGHAEARATVAPYGEHHLAIYDRVRDRALFKYRADVATAKAGYHEDIAETWRDFGRPMVSAECKARMQAAWALYLVRLRNAGAELDAAPDRAMTEASISYWRA